MFYQLTGPAKVSGQITLPTSKSISNRALILHALSGGEAQIVGLSACDDTRVMVKAFQSDSSLIDIGAAGTSMRFLTAYLAQRQGEYIITGTERMKQRPIGLLVEALNALGADVCYEENKGFPPLRIHGTPLLGGQLTLRGNVSSQFISALLMIAPLMQNGLEVTLTGEIVSIPYIRMTLGMMQHYGVASSWQANVINVPHQPYQSVDYVVEGDWSAASYWYALSALSGSSDLSLLGLRSDSLQGDSAGAKLFEQLGVATRFTDRGGELIKSDCTTDYLDYDFSNEPDIAQTFVVVCCLLGVRFKFSGLRTLKIKETDRIAALICECGKLGFVIRENEPNTLEWSGETKRRDDKIVIRTYEDHRMAMAFAPAALCIEGVTIAEPAVVSKSYPEFWSHLKEVGFKIVQSE